MRKLGFTIATIFTLASVPFQGAHAGSYQDAMKTCGAEWKASDARKQVEKGKGREAWQTFRAECTKRVGWEKKGKEVAKKADKVN